MDIAYAVGNQVAPKEEYRRCRCHVLGIEAADRVGYEHIPACYTRKNNEFSVETPAPDHTFNCTDICRYASYVFRDKSYTKLRLNSLHSTSALPANVANTVSNQHGQSAFRNSCKMFL